MRLLFIIPHNILGYNIKIADIYTILYVPLFPSCQFDSFVRFQFDLGIFSAKGL